jgi:hypothetical protein
MARGRAHIHSPDVIRDFRAHFIEFVELARRAIDDINRDVTRTQRWLEEEQAVHWKGELRRREELVQRAQSAYTFARLDSSPLRKTSCIDELKELDRARRRREEADEKLRAIKKWRMAIEQSTARGLGPVHAFGSAVTVQGAKAVARLDRMLDTLEAYLRDAPSPGPNAPARGDTDAPSGGLEE